MRSSTPATSPATPLDTDWPCMNCGYNLRSLPSNGVCTECGLAIDKSLRTRPLTVANASWLRRIRIGLLVLLFAAIGCFLFKGMIAWFPPLNLNRGPMLSFSIGGSNSILCLGWPLALLPAAILLRRPDDTAVSPHWPGRFLLPIVCIHILFLITAIIVRIIWWGGWNPAFSRAMHFEPVFLVLQIWLLICIIEALSLRIPGNPMAMEAAGFRRIFCLVLFMSAAGDLILEITSWRIIRTGLQHSSFPYPSLAFAMLNTAHLCLIPLWLYLPVFLLRFQFHLRQALRNPSK